MEGSAAPPPPPKRNNMDYSLAALKLFGCQLAGATEASSSDGTSQAQMLYGIRFQRVWLQGVVVLADYRVGAGHLLLDDGSSVAEITLTPKEAEGQPWREGMYVMVIGSYSGKDSLPRANRPVIKVPVTSLILFVPTFSVLTCIFLSIHITRGSLLAVPLFCYFCPYSICISMFDIANICSLTLAWLND
ncbi:hypothetical protein E2562_032728 [Oryza meyeriana var. granulata]|uniref:Uncharacterized protein n=1 Tax=Oryza meyeriana var. granulata TaxID=110450 RepID=A0A6G1ES18_9ORYZ|nr:hypothetical protein E2562_032728 [Oryza meyeriana var. granulata]